MSLAAIRYKLKIIWNILFKKKDFLMFYLDKSYSGITVVHDYRMDYIMAEEYVFPLLVDIIADKQATNFLHNVMPEGTHLTREDI